MGKAKALPRPYFTGEGRVVAMLGAALSTLRGSGCPPHHRAAPAGGTFCWHGSAGAAETALSSCQKVMF